MDDQAACTDEVGALPEKRERGGGAGDPVAAGSCQIQAGDGLQILMALKAEEDAGTGTTATQGIRGKSATSPEGYFEVVAKTTDGVAHAGVASVVISLDTETGVIEFTGAIRLRMGTTYIEMTEQSSDPAAPGLNRFSCFRFPAASQPAPPTHPASTAATVRAVTTRPALSLGFAGRRRQRPGPFFGLSCASGANPSRGIQPSGASAQG